VNASERAYRMAKSFRIETTRLPSGKWMAEAYVEGRPATSADGSCWIADGATAESASEALRAAYGLPA
jgi:hypothetical protein